jgi:uridine kinase
VEPSKREADIIIPRGGHNHVAIQMVMSRIQELLRLVENGALES